MRQRVSKYSRMIAWLKILLPMTALALLSTTFLLSRDADMASNLPVSFGSGPGGTVAEQVKDPYFSGTTASGGTLTMAASVARPTERGDEVEADVLDATIVTGDGGEIVLTAPRATISVERDDARLTGGVTVTSSTGYRMTTDRLNAALSRIEAESLGPVDAVGPAGQLTAGRMRITGASGDDIRLLFTDGVNLIYDPQTE